MSVATATTRPAGSRGFPPWLLPWSVFLLALGIRAWQLTFHSLWLDEAFSLFWAGKPAAEIVRVGLTLTEDKHPPLYYLMLHGWTALFGTGDVAARSLGVILGSCAVFPVFGLGRILGGGRSAGLLAALFVALNPFLVWYSQEVRMFGPATTFGLVGLYAWLRADAAQVGGDGTALWRRIAWYGLSLLGLLSAAYSYLFAAFLFPVAAVWWLLARVRRLAPAGSRRASELARDRLDLDADERGRTRIKTGLGRSERIAATRRPGTSSRLTFHALRSRRAASRPPEASSRFTFYVSRFSPFLPGLTALLLLFLLFLPLALAAWRVSGAEATPGTPFAGVGSTVWRLLRVYTVRQVPWPAAAVTVATACAAFVLLIGLLRPRTGRLFLLAWLALPLLAGNVLLAKDGTVFAETRYFIFLLPVVCIAWARGSHWLWVWRRPAGGLAAFLMLGVTLAALPSDWRADPVYRREDWRSAATYITQHATARDVVVVHVDYARTAFERYYRGAAPVVAPFGTRLADEAAVEAALDPLVARADTVWLVLSHQEGIDPANLVRAWLGGRFPLVTEQFPAGIALRGYATHYRLDVLPPTATVVDAGAWQDGSVRLAACDLEPGPVRATDQDTHPPSGWAHVSLYWRAMAPPRADDRAVVHLVDGAGQVWGAGLVRADSALQVYPMTRWQPGEIVRDDHDVNLNPLTPAGRYRITVRLQAPDGTLRDPEATCGTLRVVR